MAQQADTYVKTHPETGKQMERVAETPTERVALEFDGWTLKSSKSKSTSTSTSASSSTRSSNS